MSSFENSSPLDKQQAMPERGKGNSGDAYGGAPFVDNRPASVQQNKMQSMANASSRGQALRQLKAMIDQPMTAADSAPAVAQLQTDILHGTGTAEYKGAKGTVGVDMVAKLDPDDKILGSATNPSEDGASQKLYEKVSKHHPKAFARGHLLNHDLGGFGVNENLYPITAGANARHSLLVEQPVKRYLQTADKHNKTAAKANKLGVKYEVNVLGTPASAQFECTWKYVPIDPDSTYKFYKQEKSALIASKLSDEKDPYIPAGHEIGLQGWNHGARKGVEDLEEVMKNKSLRFMRRKGKAPALKDASNVTTLSEKQKAEQLKWARANKTELSPEDKEFWADQESAAKEVEDEKKVMAGLPPHTTRSKFGDFRALGAAGLPATAAAEHKKSSSKRKHDGKGSRGRSDSDDESGSASAKVAFKAKKQRENKDDSKAKPPVKPPVKVEAKATFSAKAKTGGRGRGGGGGRGRGGSRGKGRRS